MIDINQPKIVSLDDAILTLNGSKSPFIFVDACSFLDILRIPVPDRQNTLDILLRLIEIKSFLVSGQLLAFSSGICIKEYNDHANKIVVSLPDQINTIQKQLHVLIDFVNASGLSGEPLLKSDLRIFKLERFFVDLAQVITDSTFFVEVSQELKESAYVRLINKVPPALYKGEYKDCIVWETFLALRAGQVDKSKPAFFLSSNTKDYSEPPQTRVFHPKLQREVDALNSHYATDYSVLCHKLRELAIFEAF